MIQYKTVCGDYNGDCKADVLTLKNNGSDSDGYLTYMDGFQSSGSAFNFKCDLWNYCINETTSDNPTKMR